MGRKKKKQNQAESVSQPDETTQPPVVETAVPAEPRLSESIDEVGAGQSERAEHSPIEMAGGVDSGNAGSDQADIVFQEDAETRSKRAFFGRSGQLAVMAEFLHRRINVAMPEVDVGDDVFVVKGVSAEVTRVQVKGATAREQQNGFVALINVPEDQLQVPVDNPPLVYVFPIRRKTEKEGRWTDFIVIRRGTLLARYVNEQAGTQRVQANGKPYVQFRIVLTATTALSGPGQVNFQKYRDAWNPWPPLTMDEEEDVPGLAPQGGEEEEPSAPPLPPAGESHGPKRDE